MAMITTLKGDLDEAVLMKRVGQFENDNEFTVWTEYLHEGEVVRRDVHVSLKPLASAVAAASLGA